MKSHEQQVADALWYLRKPGQTEADEEKAIEILSSIAWPKSQRDAKVAKIQATAGVSSSLEGLDLTGKRIATGAGHQPGGGALGERAWNLKLNAELVRLLQGLGAEVVVYTHKFKSYGPRQNAMAAAIRHAWPNGADVVVENHYNAVKSKAARGHEFFYYSAEGKKLAGHVRDEWQRVFPNSVPRAQNGIKKVTSGNGAGFLRKAPGIALLPEPFFRSNPAEWAFFKDRVDEVALVYAYGIAKYLLL